MKFKIFLITLLGLLQSCATVESNGKSSTHSFEMHYGFYSYSRERLTGYDKKTGLKLIFPTIPGALFGNPTDDILHVSEPTEGYTFNLPLPSNVDDKAATFREPGLSISPSNTKVLRLATFHAYPPYEANVGGGGFINTATGNFLILVYFSNPVDITGTVLLGEDRFDHEITTSSAGWNWIEISELSKNRFRLSDYHGNRDSIEFSVLINDAFSI